MKAPAIDYRKLRLNNINTPEYRHLLLLLGWVGYFILYLLTENLIPAESCYPVHCWLDDVVPFCEWFIIPYVSWYFLIIGSLAYFLFYSVDSFKKLQTYIIITQIIAMAVYIIFPTRQDLRPTVMPSESSPMSSPAVLPVGWCRCRRQAELPHRLRPLLRYLLLRNQRLHSHRPGTHCPRGR